MKKITVLLITLAFAFSFTNVSFAQEQQNTSDTAVTAKKRPAPIDRAHIVEDYLPILGKQARANGIRPPKPFFVSAIYYHMEIPQDITNAVGWGFYGVTENNAQPVGMYNAKVETNSYGLRAGVNILPFLSVFGVYIHTDVTSKFTAVVDVIPGVMSNGYKLDQALKVKADTGAIGVAASYGLRLGQVVPFAVINANYAWSFSNMTTKSIESLIVGARLGLSVPLPKDMKVGFSFGAQYMYMPMGNEVQGQYTVTLPAGTIDGTTTPVTITSKYRANAQYASPWTVNAGIIFSPIRYFDIVTEFGFLTRFTAMVALQANF